MYKRSYNLPGVLAMAVISAIEQVGTPLTVANKGAQVLYHCTILVQPNWRVRYGCYYHNRASRHASDHRE